VLAVEVIEARGHPNIRATHKTTLEITREPEVSLRGDCIVGVKADKAAADLNPFFREILLRQDSLLVAVIEVEDVRDVVLALGSPNLILTDPKRLIIRKSSFIEPATLGIKSNKAAGDLDKLLVEKLKSETSLIVIKLYAFTLEYLKQVEASAWSGVKLDNKP